MALPSAGVLAGVDANTLLLLASSERADVWKGRLGFPGEILTLDRPREAPEPSFTAVTAAGAAARLVGVIPRETLDSAVRSELAPLGAVAVERGRRAAAAGWERMARHGGRVTEREETGGLERPEWIELPFDEARISAPAIHAALTSEAMPTGLWRTIRPVIHDDLCHRCWWICSTLCPDGAIAVEDGVPRIDYEHCKGCLVCVAVCPHHAIEAIPERAAASGTGGAG